jgi:hypothetical protein
VIPKQSTPGIPFPLTPSRETIRTNRSRRVAGPNRSIAPSVPAFIESAHLGHHGGAKESANDARPPGAYSPGADRGRCADWFGGRVGRWRGRVVLGGAAQLVASSSSPGHLGAGGQGSNARSGPAAGGSSGAVGNVAKSSFTLTTSAGQKMTVDEHSSTKYEKGLALQPRAS